MSESAWASGMSSPTTALSIAESAITRTRPNRSDSTLAGTIMIASMPVVADTVSAAAAGPTRNSSESAGSTA